MLFQGAALRFLVGWTLTLEALKKISENLGDQKLFFQFEIIINVLVISFWFIWIPMLWVYGHYKYVYSYSTGIDFSRQNLTSTDVRFWRLKSIPALQGLKNICYISVFF